MGPQFVCWDMMTVFSYWDMVVLHPHIIWQWVKTNSTPSVHIKIAGLKWMFIPLKLGFMDVHPTKHGIFIGIDP